MPSVRLERLSFAFDDSQPILTDADLHLTEGWTALVGENGAGKTTLLRLLAGEAEAHRLRGLLGLEPAGLARWESLSPGERKRWQVGAALRAEPDVLLLDEPTNHLDLPAVERLEEALAAYPGAVLLVTHDTPLAARCTRGRWRIERGRVIEE
jgi:ATPase subunit of ABC transporter with duplicated ATPase domains